MEKVEVKPKKGLKVRDPGAGKHLPVEGQEVELSQYYLRRIRCGDIELCDQNIVIPGVTPPRPEEKPKEKPKGEKKK